MNDWINTKTRLPEKGQWVIAWVDGSFWQELQYIGPADSEDVWEWECDRGGYMTARIEGWMIPSRPMWAKPSKFSFAIKQFLMADTKNLNKLMDYCNCNAAEIQRWVDGISAPVTYTLTEDILKWCKDKS